MKTCFNTITCGADKPLEQTIEFMGRVGYEGIEIETGRLDDYLTRHSLDDLIRSLDRASAGVAAIMAFPFFAFNKQQQDEHLARVEHYAALAHDLRCHTLLCFICDAPPEGMGIAEAIEVAGRAAQRYGEASGQHGVKCALEPIGGSAFMPGPRQALAVAGASGSANVGIMMDTFHYYKSKIAFEDVKAIPPDYLLIVHVNDCPDLPLDELTDGHRVYPGKGVLPLKEIFGFLRDGLNYTGYLSIEIFNQDYWADDHETVIRNAKEALDSVLASL